MWHPPFPRNDGGPPPLLPKAALPAAALALARGPPLYPKKAMYCSFGLKMTLQIVGSSNHKS